MEYTFGDKLICDSMEAAQAAANNPAVKKKCVTLAGDVVDPQGVMTGGSSGNLGTTLKKLSMLAEVCAWVEPGRGLPPSSPPPSLPLHL